MPDRHRDEVAELLELVADRALSLRRAGVTSFAIGDLRVDLAAFEPEPAAAHAAAPDESTPANPLDDPELYGGELPRLARFHQPADSDMTDDEMDEHGLERAKE